MSTERPLSFELLYQDYSRRVYRWAYRLLGSHEAADPQNRYEGNNEQVALALGALTRNARLALVLHISGYHEEEIARFVGRTSRTVRTWLVSGRAQLMEAMEEAR